jgi:hypothetical protein
VSAREEIAAILWLSVPSNDNAEAKVKAEQMLDAYRDEVLADAGLLPKADVVAWLTKKAREDTPVWQLASKVERGAVRPDNLRMLPATFFEAGRTYTASVHADVAFDCLAVSADPNDGKRVAIGWRYGPPVNGVRPVKLAELDDAAFACCDWTEGTIGGVA